MKRVLVLLCFIATFMSCGEKQTKEQTIAAHFEIPELLDRPEKIRLGSEWDLVQNKYAALLQQINAKPQQSEPFLTCAELFINEARISGEHGHYYPGALKVLEKSLQLVEPASDEQFRALSLKASVLLSQHEFHQALAIAKQAVQINTYNAAIYGILVDAYVELGDYDKAIAMADKMVSIRPDLRSYSRISYLREIHGDPKGAIQAMGMAVAAGSPGYEQTAWTRLTLGELYQRYGSLEQAENQYKMALIEREDYPFAIAALADIALKKNEIDQAENLLQQACSIIPEVGFYQQLMTVYQKKENQSKVDQLKNAILEMLADDVEHGHNMNLEYTAFYLDHLNDPKTALSFALKEYDQRPQNIDVNKLLSKVYKATGQAGLAEKHRLQAMRTGSKDPELLMIAAHLSQTE